MMLAGVRGDSLSRSDHLGFLSYCLRRVLSLPLESVAGLGSNPPTRLLQSHTSLTAEAYLWVSFLKESMQFYSVIQINCRTNCSGGRKALLIVLARIQTKR